MIEVEFVAETALTLTAALYAVNSDSVVEASVTVTEQANSKGAYVAQFASPPLAPYLLIAYDTVGPTAVAAAYAYIGAASGRFRSGFYADVVCAAQTQLLLALARNKTVTSQTSGEMKVFDDDNTTELVTASLFEDVAETQPYRGRGAEVRGRLVPP